MRKWLHGQIGTNLGHQSKNGTNGRPGRTVTFFRDTSLKIGTVPENPGRMVTLPNPADLKDTLHNDTGRRAVSLQATVLLAAEVSDAEADMWSGPVELKRRTGQRRTKSRSRQATNAMC